MVKKWKARQQFSIWQISQVGAKHLPSERRFKQDICVQMLRLYTKFRVAESARNFSGDWESKLTNLIFKE